METTEPATETTEPATETTKPTTETTEPTAEATEPTPPRNDAALKKDINEAVKQIIAYKADRAAINGNINKIKSGIVSKGIPKRALNRAIQDFETFQTEDGNQTVRDETEAYWIAREAMGLSSEPKMFEEAA